MYTPSEKTNKQIDSSFVYHAPKGDQAKRYEAIRAEAKLLAEMLTTHCPESRELSLALTSLQQAIMWANASIAINE